MRVRPVRPRRYTRKVKRGKKYEVLESDQHQHLQSSYAHVAKGNGIAVILKEDGACPAAEAIVLTIFAFAEARLPVLGTVFDLYDFFAVEPLFDSIALHADFSAVPFACRVDRFGSGRGDELIEGGRTVVGLLPVYMALVIENLILQSEVASGAVLDAAVPAFLDLPVENEFEVLVVVTGDNVARRVILSRDDTRLNAPSVAHRLSVELYPL